MNELIADTLCQALDARGLTPHDCALSLGIGPSEVERICDGHGADTSQLTLLSHALGCNLLRPLATLLDNE